MTEPPPPTPTIVPPAEIERIQALYEDGQYRKAHDLAVTFGPLKDWAGADAQILAGRMAANLGAPRLAAWLHTRARRGAREHPQAIYYDARNKLGQRGPLAAWTFASRYGAFEDLPGITPALHADWLTVLAEIASDLRDFHRADQHIAAALRLAPEAPWLHVVRAAVFEAQDRYDDALAAAERSLALRPWFRPALQAKARFLELQDRAAEARDLLRAATERVESGYLVVQLAAIEMEGGDPRAARRLLDEVLPPLLPLMEEPLRQGLDAQRAAAAYRCGDLEAAIALGERSGEPFLAKISANLKRSGDQGRRVLLPVGFVRQHHVTCAPATLATIARFWSLPAEHLEIAEEICYDGTPAQSERRWAEQAGWRVRELTVDGPSAIALIDRGIPFTFTLTSADAGHLQAIIGYDTGRGTLLVRDPYYSAIGELMIEGGLEAMADFGPRGMALVPAERAGLLDDLDLPDAARYDALYEVQIALEDHDRAAAQAACERLLADSATHRLTLHARLALAAYDGDALGQLEAVEALLAQFPQSQTLGAWRLQLLEGLERHEARLEMLRELSSRPGGHPIFKEMLAAALLPDSREHARAARLLCQAIRARPQAGRAYHLLGRMLLEEGRGEQALPLLRFAACLDDKQEAFAAVYFSAAIQAGHPRQAFGLLRDRVGRFGRQSSLPARTLHWALEQVDRDDEAFDLLEEALDMHPDDGELLCYAANVFARYGEPGRADALQAAARGRVARPAWLRSAAAVAAHRGDLALAGRHWRAVVESEPLAMDAQAALAQVLIQTAGREATLAHLGAACERFSHHLPLHGLYAQWLRDDDRRAAEAVLRHVLGTINPRDAWTQRELALNLADQDRLEEARRHAELAREIEPRNAPGAAILGRVRGLAGDLAAAAEQYRAAIRLDVDYQAAIYGLMAVTDSPAARWQALELVRSELVRQSGNGDGILAYREVAEGVLSPERLLGVLRDLHAARPDLWQTWSMTLMQHLALGQAAAAKALAVGMTERFPYLPRSWLDRAQVHAALGERDDEARCLERALSISPGWEAAARPLASLYLSHRADPAAARAVLERAIRHLPAEPANHAALARVLWAEGEQAAAVDRLSQAVRCGPEPDEPWNLLHAWCQVCDRPEVPVALARELTERRPYGPAGWYHLARMLGEDGDQGERLAAFDRALALEPRNVDAHDGRVIALVEAGRLDEALSACAPPVFGDRPPYTLSGRAAWVMARQGRMTDAIRHMRAVVDAHPGYYWGWVRLAEWCEAVGDGAGEIEAVRRMTGLAPDDAQAWGFLGDALKRGGDAPGAREAFGRALAIDPAYLFAGLNAFVLDILAGDLDAAEATLRAMEIGQASASITLGCHAELDARRGRREAALEGMRRLARDADADVYSMGRAVDAIVEAGWRQPLLDLVDAVEQEAEPMAAVWGSWWVILAAQQEGPDAARKVVARLREHGREPLARAAGIKLIRRFGYEETPAGRARLLAYLREDAAWLAEDAETWGWAAWAYSHIDEVARCIAWTDGWRQVDGAQPWMLANRLHCLLDQGRDDEARDLSLAALAIENVPDGDRGLPLHRAWLAFDAALRGQVAPARAALASIHQPDDNPDVALQVAMALALIDAAEAEAGAGPKSAIAAARRRIEAAANDHPTLATAATERWLRRLYGICLERLDRAEGGLRGLLGRLRR